MRGVRGSIGLFFAFLISCVMGSAIALAQAPSTPEERARLVAIAHKLQDNPLDTSLQSDREWAIKWLTTVPDITVEMCPPVLGDYHKYKYSTEITAQLMLSQAAFLVENPDKSKDVSSQYVAGAEGALKAYSSLLQQSPGAKSKALDELAQTQSQGKLKEFVEDAAKKSCKH